MEDDDFFSELPVLNGTGDWKWPLPCRAALILVSCTVLWGLIFWGVSSVW